MVRALITGKNPELARGIRKFGSSHFRKPKLAKKVKAKVAPKTKKFQGKDIAVGLSKGKPRFYPTEPRRASKPKKTVTPPRAQLRKSITPGTVLIVLAGQFRGRRVVFLKQLESGLLLVTGPFVLNGVPFRRISQAFVIATSTKINISSVELSASLNDAFFKAPARQPLPVKAVARFWGKVKTSTPLSAERKALQKSVDTALVAQIKKVELLESYISSRFTLRRGQYPHALKW
jgi:large subunit ribosomal protein L6e